MKMSQDASRHPSQAQLTGPENEQIHENIADMNEQDYSFTITRFKPEHWQNLNDFGDSQMVMLSSKIDEQIQNGEDSFYKETEKALNQYKQIKESQKSNTADIKIESSINQWDNLKTEKKPTKKKMIEKNKKKQFKNLMTAKKDYNISNLKSISNSVCNYVESCKFTTYSELFDRFIGNNSQEENKNLRRRMYDVINVLSSAKVIEKKSVGVKKVYQRRSFGFFYSNNYNQESFEETRNKVKQLKFEHEEIEKRVDQKRKILEQLRQKKEALERLKARNIEQRQIVSEQAKINMPFYIYNSPLNELSIQRKDSNTISVIKQQGQNAGESKTIKRKRKRIGKKIIKKMYSSGEVIKFVKIKRRGKNKVNQQNHEAKNRKSTINSE